MISNLWNKLPTFLKNRYSITALAFLIWVAFFDQHNLISQIELKADLYQLNQDKEYFAEQIVEIRENLDELLSDNSKLERFAREKYYMKKDGEEIFVFVSEDE